MKTTRRLLALLIVLCLVFAVCPLHAFAEPVVGHLTSGDFGSGFSYVYNHYHAILMIDGEGALPSFTENDPAPWHDCEGDIRRVVLGEGITEVPAGAFSACRNLASAVFPTTIESIGEGAFPGSGRLFTTANTVGSVSSLRRLLNASGVYPDVVRLSQKSLDDEVWTLSNPGFPDDYYYPVKDRRTIEQIKEQMWRDEQDALDARKRQPQQPQQPDPNLPQVA